MTSSSSISNEFPRSRTSAGSPFFTFTAFENTCAWRTPSIGKLLISNTFLGLSCQSGCVESFFGKLGNVDSTSGLFHYNNITTSFPYSMHITQYKLNFTVSTNLVGTNPEAGYGRTHWHRRQEYLPAAISLQSRCPESVASSTFATKRLSDAVSFGASAKPQWPSFSPKISKTFESNHCTSWRTRFVRLPLVTLVK